MRRLKEREVVILLFLLVMVTTAGLSIKYRRRTPKQELLKIARETAQMWEYELDLSAAQRKQVRRVITTYSGKKNQVLNTDINKDVQANRLKTLQTEEQNIMAEILTNNQYERYLHLTRARIQGLHF